MFYKVKGNKNFKKLINSQEVIDNKQEINYNEYKLIIISDEEFERDCNINATPKGLKNSQAKGSSLDETLENNGVPTKQLFK